MELILRLSEVIFNIVAFVLSTIQNFILPRKKPKYGPIKNKLLTKSVMELVLELRQKKVTSKQITEAYIARIQEVNPTLNAVIENRFDAALKEAEYADQLIAKATRPQLVALFARYPMLGIPFTVKESCAVKGLSFTVGNIHRVREKAPNNGEVVEQLCAAGCIPLLVSNLPEFCGSLRTENHIHGRSLNPYDLRRSPGGSSGGEAALNATGASLFGLGSDFAGSVRLPALFCGLFGHKPTGGLVSIKGHFPNSEIDKQLAITLQLGPITRFARDLPLLVSTMAGSNAAKLKLNETLPLKDIKIYYSYGYNGINRFIRQPVAFDIKLSITRAVKCFEKGGLTTKEVHIEHLKNSLAIFAISILQYNGVQSVMSPSVKFRPSFKVYLMELFRCVIGHSLYTTDSILVECAKSFLERAPPSCYDSYAIKAENLKTELTELLGTDGVLLFPTFHTAAVHHNVPIFNSLSYDMMAVFNILGFPVTHVPMGLDRSGCPVGFSVIAGHFQDKLCFQIAAELEGAFGGFQPAQENELSD